MVGTDRVGTGGLGGLPALRLVGANVDQHPLSVFMRGLEILSARHVGRTRRKPNVVEIRRSQRRFEVVLRVARAGDREARIGDLETP